MKNPTTPQARDKVGGQNDRRPWRQRKLKLPENVATLLEEALAMAVIFGEASNEIQAVEAICADYLLTHSLAAAISSFDATDTLRVRSLEKKIDCGFRCIRCEHSKDLHVHHGWPKSYYGPERPADINDPDNLFVICATCHEEIHATGWRKHVASLIQLDIKARKQVQEFGWRYTAKHGKEQRWI